MGPSPHSSDLEQLRRQAKELLKACRAGAPQARHRVAAQLPRVVRPDEEERLLLADALFVIARERGFRSWPRLKTHLEKSRQRAERRASRQRALHEQAATLVAAARQGDIANVARQVSSIPLGSLLSIRAIIAASDDYRVVMDALIAGIEHPGPAIRYACAGAMDHLADARCIGPLRRLLDDPVPRVRRMALHALSCDACKLSPLPTDDDFVALAIERALHDPSIQVRRHAVAELSARCDDPRALQALTAIAARETDGAIIRQVRWARREAATGG
ncbi:MAG TPA: HEAT repeat domain-containing protein [Chloroflexota bacterium]|nr:HEAT repeat domain-containing protein [Chloroflexota bacterium]